MHALKVSYAPLVVALWLSFSSWCLGCSSGNSSPAGGGDDGPAPAAADSTGAQPTTADRNEPTPTGPALPPLPEPELKMTAEELGQAFRTDKKAAEEKYVGKRLRVTGKRDIAFPMELSDVVVGLEGPGDSISYSVQVRIHPKAAGLVMATIPGQTVVVDGTCTGHRIFVNVEDARVVEIGPDSSPAVTAEELTRLASSDPEEFERKYGRRWLQVDGVYLGVDADNDMRLKGHDDQHEAIVIADKTGLKRYGYKTGQTVRLKANNFGADENGNVSASQGVIQPKPE